MAKEDGRQQRVHLLGHLPCCHGSREDSGTVPGRGMMCTRGCTPRDMVVPIVARFYPPPLPQRLRLKASPDSPTHVCVTAVVLHNREDLTALIRATKPRPSCYKIPGT